MNTAPSSSRARAQPSSSRGSHRGGRGRGNFPDAQAPFRGRSGGPGNPRGRGRGDGYREGRGFMPKKLSRHRSLSGKHGAHTQQDGRPAEKREKKDQKPNSNFAHLHSMLGDAATIAEYIREYHSSDKFRDIKSVNTFLQAVSQRPEAVYQELMSKYKEEVFTTLERLFSVYALSKHPMTPSAHEFLIRCEQEGVRKSAWGEGVRTLPVKATVVNPTSAEGGAEGVAPSPQPPAPAVPPPDEETASLLSPRELLKKMAALDAVGRLQRLIELSKSVEELQVCAKKLNVVLMDMREEAEGDSTLSSTSTGVLDYSRKCQLISKLLSKARRCVEPAFATPLKTATESPPGDHPEDITRKEVSAALEDEEVSDRGGDDGVAEAEARSDLRGTCADGVVPVTPVLARCRDPLTRDEIEGFQAIISLAFHALETVLEQRAPNVAQQPFSKFSKVLEWCKEKGLLAVADERFISLMEQKTESDLAQQATELETVIKLKSLTVGDTVALREVVDQLWEAGCAKFFSPSSVDVLSAIAVAASVENIDADVKRMIADRLVQTQRHLASTVVLPRRALRFVNDERNKVKQAAITKQLEQEASKYRRADSE